MKHRRPVLNQLACFVPVTAGLLLSFFLLPQAAGAHKVNIFAYAQESRVYAEGYFVDGTKCRNSVIEVVDAGTGEKLLEGKTDANGQFSFDIPRAASLKLILHAGAGHQSTYLLTGEEIGKAMPGDKKKRDQYDRPEREEPGQRPVKSGQSAEADQWPRAPVISDDMEEIIGKVVDSKLQPVIRILADIQEKSGKPGLTEILGGIGYIIGILGIIAYFKGRRSDRKS